MLLENTKLEMISVYGFIISWVGIIILIIAIYKPSYLIKRLLKKKNESAFKSYNRGITIFYGLVGLLLLIGGIIYSFTGNSSYLVLHLFE